MRKWIFENRIKVYEVDFDYDLHALEVYHNKRYLGTIYPADIADMETCFDELDKGNDPIDGHWEDGLGNSCSLNGWGENV